MPNSAAFISLMHVAVQVANSWRTTGDIEASWDSMLRCLDNTVGLSEFAGPGAWNDPDMLEVTHTSQTFGTQQTSRPSAL